MEGLHYSGPSRTRSVVTRRGNQWKGVVEMNHVRPVVPSSGFDYVVTCSAPNRRARQLEARQVSDSIVGHRQPTDIVPIGLQDGLLSLKYTVLTTGELVEVVDE